ncbi:hypothetical protein L9F63_005666 [Diploptera punctata]|uniref:BRCT domain-containing protein n=1 Tax=Diploptera punctata TaxID=6984 RepID=A0AAD7ZC10_DIPPU|nr:hypothetical protein L9F63_005666 [Diploptera punctata]
MAARDLLDFVDEQFSTPCRQSLLPETNKSSLSSSRKSGKFRKLYTPDSMKSNENKRRSVRRKLSSVSRNATIGNVSLMDSSLDFVDTTPCIETTKSHTSIVNQPYLHKTVTSAQISTLRPKSTLWNDVSEYTSASTSEFKRMEKIESNSKMKGIPISGITSLMKNPVSNSEELSSDSLSSTTDETPGKSCNAMNSKRLIYTPETPCNESVEREVQLQTPGRASIYSVQEMSIMEEMGMRTPRLFRMESVETKNKTSNDCPSLVNKIVALRRTPRQSVSSPLKKTDEDLPPTQPVASLIMKDVIGYVEVRFGGDNRSLGIKAHISSLGATVREKFTNDVTHVIFNEGLMSTYKKAMKKNIHLVSVLWIEACEKAQGIVSERLYPPCDIEKYESPHLLKRFRKVRSYQPDFGESGERRRRRRKKIMPEKENEPEIELPEYPLFQRKMKVPGFLESACKENELVRALLTVADIGPEYEEVVNRPTSPTLSEEEDMPNPPTLAVRLLRKMLTPKSSPIDEAYHQTPKNNFESVTQETQRRELISMQSNHVSSSEKTGEKDNSSKSQGENSKLNSTPSNSEESCKIPVKSPKLGRINKVVRKLSKSMINNPSNSSPIHEMNMPFRNRKFK